MKQKELIKAIIEFEDYLNFMCKNYGYTITRRTRKKFKELFEKFKK